MLEVLTGIPWQVYVLSFAVSFLGGFIAYWLVSKRSGKQEVKVRVTLEELSQLWLRDSRQQTTDSVSPSSPLSASGSPPASGGGTDTVSSPCSVSERGKSEETSVSADEKASEGKPVEEQTQQKEQIVFRHPELNDFWREHVEAVGNPMKPYREAVARLLAVLDEHGDVPSVVSAIERRRVDREAKQFRENVYEALGRVTLLEHTLNVVAEAQRILKQRAGETWKLRWGPVLLTVLAHDLGKAEALVKAKAGKYAMGDHAILSASILRRELEGCVDADLLEEIEAAVRTHHAKPKGELGEILKEADARARSKECDRLGVEPPEEEHDEGESEMGLSISEFNRRQREQAKRETIEKTEKQADEVDLEWLDVEDFLAWIRRLANVESGDRFWVFSDRKSGYVYVFTEALSKYVFTQAREKGKVDVLRYEGEGVEGRRVVEKALVRKLRKAGIVGEIIGEGYTGGRFELIFEREGREERMRGFYTPLKVEKLGIELSELEKQKHGRLRYLKAVRPLFGGE